MKIFILFAILGMMLFSACTEQDIEPFGERHEVYFYKYFIVILSYYGIRIL